MAERLLRGRVIKGVGGFYTVLAAPPIAGDDVPASSAMDGASASASTPSGGASSATDGRIASTASSTSSLTAEPATVLCGIRGALHRADRICVGDEVRFDPEARVIEEILPRRNFLLRPSVANVDQLLFLVAPSPKPDYLLLDKILIRCLREGVPVLLCMNKQDLAEPAFEADLRAQYGAAAERILVFSALTGEGTREVRRALEGRFSCLSGQSAVGKSSLLNALYPDLAAETGGLTKRTERGRHTTRHSEIFVLGDVLLCDTPGFSSFLLDVAPDELADYYPEYFATSANCRYRGCTHTHEPGCAVKAKLERGELSKARYERYLALREECAQWQKSFRRQPGNQ